ncbi:hypothetical protein WR25_23924 [Diploscapter pachys]|uniref:G-patch domain-containing protein n=1 Tax=Diploscapter pachys TaxID=2018661 RepID=A0A2A2J9B9_9BILA|nr:hypothetical protein WR25_23924 [Diploscapter pachys]
MNSKSLAAYGTEFEELEDPTKISGLKKPTPIQEQIATDWKGRRRFHGAFTGGFSAGYFNTVGSRHGWVPQEYKSSKDQKFDGELRSRAEDYMDEEDLGEYGISARRIQQTDTFSAGTSKVGDKRRLAWEHEDPIASATGLSSALANIVKPVSNSIGYRMLRSMGWREGRGVGLATTKQTRERGGSSKSAKFDREQAAKIAPGYNLAQEDVLIKHLQAEEGLHGLGYQGLRQTTVLDEKMGFVEAALKTKKNQKKGIRGQAFGVGAFEEEDESVYTQFDLTKYDFSLDVTGKGEKSEQVNKVDATFVETPKRQNARKFYLPPKLPPNFKPEHKSIRLDSGKMPEDLRKAMQALTTDQRAKLLGEDRIVMAEALAKQQRQGTSAGERKREGRSRWDQKASDRERIAFPNEPMKQQRFKEFLHYLKRGLPYPKPTDMTVWEWEAEKKDFEVQLTNEERALLPEVKSRSQPLARSSLAAPILELMANKFTKETGSSGQGARKDEDKMAAIKLGLFGEKTRSQFTWYPDSVLAKRFNVPNPYPAGGLVGCPALQKSTKKEDIVNLGLPNTAIEMATRHHKAAHGYSQAERRHETANIKNEAFDEEEVTEGKENDKEKEEEIEAKMEEERPPEDVFAAIFGDLEVDSDSDQESSKKKKEPPRKRTPSSSSSASEKEDKLKKETKNEPEEEEKSERPKEKVLTVMDMEDEYGPAPPISGDSTQQALTGFSVLKFLKQEMEARKTKKKRKKEKERDKDGKHRKKKSKKEKKSKHSKKHRKEKKDKDKKRRHSKKSSSDSKSSKATSDDNSGSSQSSYEEA